MQAPPRFSFRLWLGALILVALVPAAAVVGFTVWKSGQTLRDNSLRLLEASARVVAHAVAGELTNTATRLHMSAAAGAHEGISFLIPPEGAPLPPDIIEQVRQTGRPAVTNMLAGENGAEAKVALILPGASGRPEALAVGLVSPTELVTNLQVKDEQLGHFLIAVTDGNGHLIARSRNPERFVGKRVPDWDDLQALGSSQGVFEARTAEGGEVIFAFHTIADTPGWVVVIGEPLEAFNARWQRPLRVAIMASLLALAVAGVASTFIARQILRPVHALARHARRVVSDANYTGRPDRATSAIAEFEVLRRSLIRAEAALRRRARAERKASEKLAHMARHDALTGLANRVLFGEKLQDAIAACADGAQGALLCLDLDLFKEVNDTHGHPVGDALLQAVAKRLQASVRSTDTVARLGGDEFAIIQTSAANQPEAATELAKRLVQALSAPFDLQGMRLVISISIGVTFISARSRNAEQLMREADSALYRAKQAGRGRFCLHEPGMAASGPDHRRKAHS